MKKVKIKFKNLLLVFGASLVLSACDKDFLEVQPIGEISTNFETTNDAVLALNAAYNSLTSVGTYNGYDPIVAMWSDDARAIPDLTVLNQIHEYTLLTDNDVVRLGWLNTYQAIFRANIVINSTPSLEDGDEELKERLIAEARFIRGTMMMRLAIYWGTAPMITTALEPDEFLVSNSTPEALWQQAIEDLEAAGAVLPESYPDSDLGRPTRGAALGFLGKAYLFNQQWQNAADQFNMIEGLGYSLLDNFSDIFVIDNNDESLFEIQFASGITEDPAGSTFAGTTVLGGHTNTNLAPNSSGFGAGGGWGFFQPNLNTPDLFEDGDIREKATFFVDGDSFEGQPFNEATQAVWPIGIAKYTRGTDPAEDGDLLDDPYNWIWMRYADVLLMHAEALIELNQVDAALTRINQVRSRAGLADLAGLDQAQARDAVRQERRVELFFEGARGFDIRRWGIVSDLPENANFVEGKHEVLPIPQVEIDNNPNLTQNNGY